MPGDFNIADDERRRTTDQLRQLKRDNESGDKRRSVVWNTEAPADFTFLYDPNNLLVRAGEANDRVVEGLRKRGVLEGELSAPTRLSESLLLYRLPPRVGGLTIPELIEVLHEDRSLERGSVTPDHWIHISPIPGRLCPANEPAESGLKEPWPPVCPCDGNDRQQVGVVVVDTGWYPPAATDPRTPWLHGVDGDDELNGPDLRPYAGHGTFIAGVVRCLAPGTEIFVEGFCIGGVGAGGILESDMVAQLDEALSHKPQVINLSAGCRTYLDLPSLVFADFFDNRLKGLDCVLVAAAGNDSSPAPFWPAAFDWAVGVGSLDRDGRVSSYSNFGASADVYALGRNVVNAFPDGTFECHETPDKGDIRVFDRGLARWSGTSFAAPVVAGLIAREIAHTGSDAATARDAVLARSVYASDPVIGPIQTLREPYC